MSGKAVAWVIVAALSTETLVLASDDAARGGMSGYRRLIVSGSGPPRRQWLEGIKKKAESMANPPAQRRSAGTSRRPLVRNAAVAADVECRGFGIPRPEKTA